MNFYVPNNRYLFNCYLRRGVLALPYLHIQSGSSRFVFVNRLPFTRYFFPVGELDQFINPGEAPRSILSIISGHSEVMDYSDDLNAMEQFIEYYQEYML